MTEVLTIEPITSRFGDEWVLIGDPETDEFLNVKRGIVLYHHRDRDTFDRESLKFHPKRFAVICLRETPEGMEYVV